MAGVDLVHVPYRGSPPALTDLLGGRLQSAWYGIGAPAKTPYDTIFRLNAEINAGLIDEKLKARLTQLGSVPFALSPSRFGKHLVAETDKWSKVVHAANIKAE
jgi:tripartite-type tricarboxylate transporter receptor subunit TctC